MIVNHDAIIFLYSCIKMMNINEEFKENAKIDLAKKDEEYTERMKHREWITMGSMEKDNEYLMNKLLRRNLYHSQSKAEDYISPLKSKIHNFSLKEA